MSGVILGLAASHNGAACLVDDATGEVLVAVQEERLTRKKRAVLEPAEGFAALDYVLEATGLAVDDISLIVTCPLRTAAAPELDLDRHPRLAGRPRALITHHRAHAVSAYWASGFDDAAVLVIDGMGSEGDELDEAERAAVVGAAVGREVHSIYRASGGVLTPALKQLGRLDAPTPGPGGVASALVPFASLGTMYQAVAQRVFGSWTEAGKVMGLAPYGRQRYATDAFLAADGPGLRFSEAIHRARLPRAGWPTHPEAWRDLARSVQEALEVGVLHLARSAAELTGSRRLCLAGGVALNGIANERIVRSGLFDEVFVLPAAEDCGTALGAAWEGLWRLRGPRRGVRLERDALGRRYGRADVDEALAAGHAGPGARVVSAPDVAEAVAAMLARGLVVGFFEGRSELGPRALGQRSILFDPRRADGKDLLNARVKHREAFRPFAPAVLAREADAWFDMGPAPESPFMLRVVPTRPERRAEIPAVVHVDGSARVQTVAADGGGLHRLLEAFFATTGVPLLLLTSFNVAGEPIVETPADALRCFASTGLDACVLEGVVVAKDHVAP